MTTALLNGVTGLLRSAAPSARVARRRDSGWRKQRTELAAELSRLTGQLQDLAAESTQMRAELSRLDRDLDESRRLNLRAAELLDIVYAELTSAPDAKARNDHRQAPKAGGAEA
ncbi:DUF6752 domain-containing protein [Arthrobacter sp.]|uniref:DUF6752 domain-containing protein n=1 Tax=Arthrobacter sp. TaxID=1667 RepID=UPI002810FBB7|nr:DUF6752 domain-containing protein [Arthrobacter sp.]